MLDLTHFFTASAWAQDAAPAASPGGSSGMSAFMNFVPLLLIFAVFYVLIIRPQQRKLDEQQKMIKALQRGDRVVTSGGILGKIVRLEGDEHIIVEIADNVQVKLLRSHVQGLAAKPTPVLANDDSSEKKPPA